MILIRTLNAADLVSSLGWTLLDFVWQGVLVGCAAAVLLGLLGRARPQWRYGVACGALLLCAALPLANLALRLAGPERPVPQPALTALPETVSTALDAVVPSHAGTAEAGSATGGWRQALQPRLPLLTLCWAGGAAVLALRLLLGLAWVRRRSRPGAYRPDPAWQAVLDRLAARMGVGRRVVLGLVDDLTSPVTAGWWRPVVLVPALLAHELAHVRRHDYRVNLVQSAIEILLFYHPAVWCLSHRIRVERELIADDLAASMLGEPRRLALALSELDLFQLSTPQLAQAAHGGKLMSRIKRLVRPQSESINWKLVLPVLGLALSAAVVSQAGTAAPQEPPAAQAQQAQQAAAQARSTAAETAREARIAAKEARTAARDSAHESARSERRAHRTSEDAFALVSGTEQNLSVSGNAGNWTDIREIRRGVDGEFLWFRDGGKSYVVQDREVLARAHAAYEPIERLGKQMDGYGKQMDQHGKAMDALGKEMSKAAAGIRPDEARIHALEREMNDLGRQMGQLGAQMGQARDEERKPLEARMARLSERMNELGKQMREASEPAGQRAAQQSMDEIGRRMKEAGKPMDALGKQMEVLGKQMEQEGEKANTTVRALIREAQAKGLARPVPQA
jgi:beta-lactamase regulating signal transducer with metallopeptidase domain/predicted  nucleic acid-binding Zn-ribbon protein